MKDNTIETPRTMNPDYSVRIRLERSKRAWTQEKLAEMCGVSARTIQRIECGESPAQETLRRIAEAFSIPVEEMQGQKMRKYFRVPSSISDNLIVLGMLGLLIFMGYLSGTGYFEHETIWLPRICILLLVINLGWIPQSLVLKGGRLHVKKNGGWSSKYDLAKLTSYRTAPYEMLISTAFPLSPIVSMGYCWSHSLGRFRSYTNDHSRTVLLEFGEQKIVVGPDNPEEFWNPCTMNCAECA